MLLRTNNQRLGAAAGQLASRIGPAAAGLHAALSSPHFGASVVTKSQLSASESAAKKKDLEERLVSQDEKEAKEPEVITLDSDSEPHTPLPPPKQFTPKPPATFPKPKHAGSTDDSDVIEILDELVPVRKGMSKSCEKDTSTVTRLNSLEAELRLKAVYNGTFLADVKAKYDLRGEQIKRRIVEDQVRCDFYSEQNRQRSAQALEERIRNHLSLTDVALEEEVEVVEDEEELPEITDEMEKVIKRAESSSGETLVDAFNISITCRDIDTLKGLNWLNDEVINFYMQMICERSKNEDNRPNVYAFNTFFYPKLASSGYTSIRRWTRKVDVFSFDLILVPVHLGMHWCLAIIDFRKPGVYYYDSMGGDNRKCLDLLVDYVKKEHQDKKKTPYDVSPFEQVIMKDIPQQMNGSDCGMFACKFAEYLSRDVAITFNQEHMPYFRRRMIYEIVSKKLLSP